MHLISRYLYCWDMEFKTLYAPTGIAFEVHVIVSMMFRIAGIVAEPVGYHPTVIWYLMEDAILRKGIQCSIKCDPIGI